MSLKWLTVNSRLINGTGLINSMTTIKFKLLLTHIVNTKNEELFTDEELKKLKDSLKLTEDNLQLLIQSIAYIFKQASKVIIKPTVLQKQLIEDLGLDAEKAEEFVKLWSSETKKDVGDFENSFKLQDVNWELNLETANQICNKQVIPKARVQFKLAKSADSSKKDTVTVEFDEEELLHLYSTLETIQIKLDNLHNTGN
ncbi:COMM domain-containing protein 10-like [Anoplophora glabripennis]|uniref:COMM domain-containing protein 10-like n=1 Tax=Anoplophora glabripennis TaxID=217634 RepID=UPI00087352D7|nr:COMM domain-containing protein 10-like [Anoplophora glabripennis]